MVTIAGQPTLIDKVPVTVADEGLAPRTTDSDWWWEVVGGHLEALLSAADYSSLDQLKALSFFYRWVTPRLGPKPISPEAIWKSFMTDDHSPVEYSWKWGFGDSAPEIRYSIEPIGNYAGAALDLLNKKATSDLLAQLCRSGQPGVDLEWFVHFKHALLGPGTPASEAGVTRQSTLFVAFEVTSGLMGVKAYFIPVNAHGNSAGDQISRAVVSTGCLNLAAMNQLNSFLRDDIYGQTVKPFMLGIDCVRPINSRLKVYSRSLGTTFELVRRVMSIGGRRKNIMEAENHLHTLWKLILNLPDDFPTDRELPYNPHETAGLLFYFDVAPMSQLPDVKVYIPVRHYSPGDDVAACGLVRYLKSQSQGAYAQQYLETLKALATKEDKSTSNGLQTYISCAYRKNALVITSYLNPQCYHPSWFAAQ
jgi:DMATS type aromatic prenyltransferase